jgi:hypothetical protein
VSDYSLQAEQEIWEEIVRNEAPDECASEAIYATNSAGEPVIIAVVERHEVDETERVTDVYGY